MSKHLKGCAGDDYCSGDCLYDGIAQPAILMRADSYDCDCDWRELHHRPNCPLTPAFTATVQHLNMLPWTVVLEERFWGTWFCVVHGHVGDINGPVHYEICTPTYEVEEVNDDRKALGIGEFRRRWPFDSWFGYGSGPVGTIRTEST